MKDQAEDWVERQRAAFAARGHWGRIRMAESWWLLQPPAKMDVQTDALVSKHGRPVETQRW